MSSKEWALALYDAGYQVVLVPLRKKAPAFAWKRFQAERVPRDLVEEWYSQGEHNLALISGTVSGTVVVDGDSAEACAYIEGMTPPTMKVHTAKGAHYYFRHPGGRVPNSVRAVDEPPIDLRGDGGLTIGPGSLHASGVFYRLPDGADIVSVRELPMFRREWFPLPEHVQETGFSRTSVLATIPSPGESYKQARAYVAKVPGAVQGQGGDDATYVLACRLVRGFDLTDAEALDLMNTWNSTCVPPWELADLSAKVRHARIYGSGEFGSMTARNSQNRVPCFRRNA